MDVQYGKCPCGGIYEKHTVEVRMTVENEPVLLAGLPQGRCPRCGSTVYKLDVLERIEGMMKHPLMRDSEQS